MAQWVDRMAKAALVAVVVGSLMSCGGDVRNDPWLQAKLKEVDAQQRRVRELPVAVSDLRDEVEVLTEELTALKNTRAGATPEALKKQVDGLAQRLAAVEKRLQTIDANIRALQKKVAAAPVRTPTTPRTTPRVKTPAPPTRTPGGVKPTPGGVKPTPAKPTPAPPKPTPARPSGFHHKAVKGDTVKNVAEKYGVSVGDLIKANNYLKPDAVLHPGQPYWVPKSPE